MKKFYFKLFTIVLCLFLIASLSGCQEAERKVSLVDNPNLSLCDYKLGDLMGNHSVTDVNGNTYKFSEIFKEKDAIVLNFWFVNCGPCQMEFPYLQAAADKYSDKIAVLAINPTDDRANSIQKYATQNELSIPLIKGEQEWISAFHIQGFPTTVVIDREGKIAFSHTGAITQEGIFEDIFEFFTAEDYEHTIVNSINEIK